MTPAGLLKAIRSLDGLPRPKSAARIRRLDPYRQLDAEQTKLAIGKMFRGATMRKHALEWKNPSVGKGAKLNADRGMIWRHVMAYSGFELYILFYQYLDSLPKADRPAQIKEQCYWLQRRSQIQEQARSRYKEGSAAPYQAQSSALK